jgi:hypothetical protein
VLKKKILVWINKKVLGELRREQTKVWSLKTNLTLVACGNKKQIINENISLWKMKWKNINAVCNKQSEKSVGIKNVPAALEKRTYIMMQVSTFLNYTFSY